MRHPIWVGFGPPMRAQNGRNRYPTLAKTFRGPAESRLDGLGGGLRTPTFVPKRASNGWTDLTQYPTLLPYMVKEWVDRTPTSPSIFGGPPTALTSSERICEIGKWRCQVPRQNGSKTPPLSPPAHRFIELYPVWPSTCARFLVPRSSNECKLRSAAPESTVTVN